MGSQVFSGCVFAVTFIASVGIGVLANFITMMTTLEGASGHSKTLVFLSLLTPGGLLCLLSLLPLNRSLTRGFLAGGSIVLLLGGLCGTVIASS
jgi:hypothetical protein